MKFLVFSTLFAAAAAFTSQPVVTGSAKVTDSPARARTATIVQDGKANGTLSLRKTSRIPREGFEGKGHVDQSSYSL